MGLGRFFAHWIVTAFSLWAVAHMLAGFEFRNMETLVIAALVLGFMNAIVRPVLVCLTCPITMCTLGLFLFVINATILCLVAWLVPGFRITNFETALVASLIISLLSWVLGVGFVEQDPLVESDPLIHHVQK